MNGLIWLDWITVITFCFWSLCCRLSPFSAILHQYVTNSQWSEAVRLCRIAKVILTVLSCNAMWFFTKIK